MTNDPGCEEVVGRLFEGASHLFYKGRDVESEAVKQLAAWLKHWRGPNDTGTLDAMEEGITPEMVVSLRSAVASLQSMGMEEEVYAISPFISLFDVMLVNRETLATAREAQRQMREIIQQAKESDK